MSRSSIPPEHRSTVLVSLAVVLAAQIPLSVQAVPDATVRSIMQTVILAVVIWLAYITKPPSKPPKAPALETDTSEPITVPDPPRRHRLGGLRVA